MATLEEDVHAGDVINEAVKVITKAICSSQGPRPACICQGDPTRCHSVALYSDYAVAAVRGLLKAGYTIVERR